MADVKEQKLKKQPQTKRVRQERRFLPGLYASRASIAGGMLGALILGAGVYGQWLRDEPRAVAPLPVRSGCDLARSRVVVRRCRSRPRARRGCRYRSRKGYRNAAPLLV